MIISWLGACKPGGLIHQGVHELSLTVWFIKIGSKSTLLCSHRVYSVLQSNVQGKPSTIVSSVLPTSNTLDIFSGEFWALWGEGRGGKEEAAPSGRERGSLAERVRFTNFLVHVYKHGRRFGTHQTLKGIISRLSLMFSANTSHNPDLIYCEDRKLEDFSYFRFSPCGPVLSSYLSQEVWYWSGH